MPQISGAQLLLSGALALVLGGLLFWTSRWIWRRFPGNTHLRLLAVFVAVFALLAVAAGCLFAGCGVLM